MFSGESESDQHLYEDEKQDRKSLSLPDKKKDIQGTFVGTPIYQAPEMIMDNVSGPFTDLWALGVIIYQMITG